ncbi:MAG: amino acid permease, partial [Leeuwenhoekiella sp.]
VLGSLSSLVEAASMAFLCTFGIVNWIAYREMDKNKYLPIIGLIMAILIGLALFFRLIISKPIALGGMGLIVVLIIFGRPYLLKKTGKKGSKNG